MSISIPSTTHPTPDTKQSGRGTVRVSKLQGSIIIRGSLRWKFQVDPVDQLRSSERLRFVAICSISWFSVPRSLPEVHHKRHTFGDIHGISCYSAPHSLPEVNREAIKGANLIACPGCYPTSVQLGFLPLLEADCIDVTDLIANSASGVSGAGRQASIGALHSEMSDSFKAYAASGHRHHPEIVQGLSDIALKSSEKSAVSLTFVPHLLPINRGIHTTLYANLSKDVDVQALFEQRYKDEPFVDVLPAGSHPETRSVRGSNFCRIAVCRPGGGNKVVVLVVEDNLTKGASGQGIQCMNIMFAMPENAGLTAPALLP